MFFFNSGVRWFTFRTGCFGQSALPFLCLRRTGLRGHKARGGVRAVDLQNGYAKPGLRSFPEPTCFVLLHTGTPLTPLAQLAL